MGVPSENSLLLGQLSSYTFSSWPPSSPGPVAHVVLGFKAEPLAAPHLLLIWMVGLEKQSTEEAGGGSAGGVPGNVTPLLYNLPSPGSSGQPPFPAWPEAWGRCSDVELSVVLNSQ